MQGIMAGMQKTLTPENNDIWARIKGEVHPSSFLDILMISLRSS